MNLVLSHAAEIALRTLGDEDRRKVHAWFDYLRNWENDEFVRSRSRKLKLPGSDEVYVLKTTTDVHLFFILHSNHIEIIDIARSDSLQTVSQAS